MVEQRRSYDLQNFVQNFQKAVCLEGEQVLTPLELVEQKIVLHYHHFLHHEVVPLITFLDHQDFLHCYLIERHLTSVLVGVWTWPYYAPCFLIRMMILYAVDTCVVALRNGQPLPRVRPESFAERSWRFARQHRHFRRHLW